MRRIFYVLVSFVFIGSLQVACNEPMDDLLIEYQAHAVEALDRVGQFREDGMNSDSKTLMEEKVSEQLDQMGEIRMKMAAQCKMDEHCSDSGGATGEMDGGHMNGGRYLDQNQMKWLMEKEQGADGALKSMDDMCDAQLEEGRACWGEHADMMEGTFDDIVQACSNMMSDHMGNKEMMDGDAGMMGSGGM